MGRHRADAPFARLGVDELSVSPALVPRVKSAIRNVSREECEKLVEESAFARFAAEFWSAPWNFARDATANCGLADDYLLRRFRFRIDFRLQPFLFHFAQDIAHVLDSSRLPGHINGRLLLRRIGCNHLAGHRVR